MLKSLAVREGDAYDGILLREDPIVRQMFQEACTKAGVKNSMEKYDKKSA
jgi:hypothetical protein